MRKIFSIFAALTLSVGLWADQVAYRYPVYNEGDVTKGIASWQTSAVDAAPVTSTSSTWGVASQETWFVVNSNVTISQRVTCKGDVHLILANGVTLNAQKGITVSGSDKLTIYAQTEDIASMGQLIATGGNMVAGIGGGSYGDGSNITINGGIITAAGGHNGAGIGGGLEGIGSNITINGGEVTATGYHSAGIGGGAKGVNRGGNGSDITINGGTVIATGDGGGAGIGGGDEGPGFNITINGGEVEATGGFCAAGIGGGSKDSGSYITINGGTVKAIGSLAAGIGSGYSGGSASDIYVTTSLVVKADGNNPPTTVITNTGADLASSLAGKQYATIEVPSATYTRDVANNSWGTLCLPWASTALEGAIFYDVLGTKDPEQGVALVELGESDNLVAGKPYVFLATSEQIKVTYNPETEVAEEVEGNNIIGSFDGCSVPEGKYIIVNNLLYKTADATSTIGTNRAYLDVDNMGVYTPSQAPGRKVVFMGGRTVPTDLETVDNAQCTMHNGKYIHKGRFVFVREGKMYNALGM